MYACENCGETHRELCAKICPKCGIEICPNCWVLKENIQICDEC